MKKCKLVGCLLAVFFCVTMCNSIIYAHSGEEEVLSTKEPKATAEPTVKPTSKPTREPRATGTPEPTREITEGTPFSEEGNVIARDLLYDVATNKQFVTIQTKNGTVFYLVIDYDKPLDKDGEKYETYFLNAVDERDLEEVLKEDVESTPIVCTCTEKCEVGSVNEDCPLCSKDIKKCVGKETATPEPTPTKAPATEQTTKEEAKQSSGINVVVILLLLLIGGGVFAYFKFGKGMKKTKIPNNLDDYEFEEDDEEEVYEKDEEEASDGTAEDEDE